MTRAATRLRRRRPHWRLPWPGAAVAIRSAITPGPTTLWPPAARQPASILRHLRGAALAAIAVLVAVSSLASFGESYRALYLWAGHHDFTGFWAAIWPLLIDTFIAIGELAVFVAMVDNWPLRHRLSAWLVTALGLSGSVAANIGHVATPDLATRATAAVPPLAAATSLWVGMGVLKRVVSVPGLAAASMTAAKSSQHQAKSAIGAAHSPATKTASDGASADRGRNRHVRGQEHLSRNKSSTRSTRSKRERVKQMLAADPGLTNTEVAKRSGASERTITRARQDLGKSIHGIAGISTTRPTA
jgi:hypothetical protein